jgi:hypothetical protein
MGWFTDWLNPDDNGRHDGPGITRLPELTDSRTKLERLAGEPRRYYEWCTGCDYPPSGCRCDRELRRPKRWWE